MNPWVGLLPLFLGMGLYAGYLKVSARIRRFQVGWRPCLVFAYLVGAMAILGRFLTLRAPPPAPLAPVLAVVSQLALGAWFFRSRARTAEGQAVGWRRASEVVAVAMLLMLGTGILFLVLARGPFSAAP
jgi:tellurite resistance protein TehA-like permease